MRRLVVALSTVACSSATPQSGGESGPLLVESTRPAAVPIDAATPDGAPRATGAVQDSACDVEAIRSCYGPARIIAGTGKIRRRGTNGWRPAFEGGNAIDAELSRPHFAMADSAGNIYVADKDAHAIRRINPGGSIDTIAGAGSEGDDGDEPRNARGSRLSFPNGLWVKADGTLYILDLGNGKVRRVSTGGQMTTLFRVPGGIAVGRGLWISDDESSAFVASGSRILQWRRGSGVTTFARGFQSLGNLVVDPDGKLVATDRAAGRVFRLGDGGTRRVIAGNRQARGRGNGNPAIDSSLPGVRAVWFDGRGGMFLGTHESSRVWYVGGSGTLQRFLGDGDVSEVRGLSLDPNGDLIVVDNDHGFIRVVPLRR